VAEHVSIEFTIEPFTDGAPGIHVTSTIAAIEAMGVAVDVGPFGSSIVVASSLVGDVLSVLTSTAYANGASHVTIDTETVE
jgi:hypothetical protein